MNDLRSRLARFDRARPAPRAGEHPAADPGGAGHLPLIPVDREPRSAVEPTLRPLEALLQRGARWVGSAPCGYLRWEEPVAEGAWPGPPACAVPADAFWRLARQDAPGPGAWAVLDTETTGLAGGAGTLVFLVAVLLWDPSGARCIQYFLPEPEGERAMLQAVIDDLATAAALVSYNGRAFDLPHLRARMRLHRIDESAFDRPHLDLLHPVRRLGAGWMPDARLATAEAQLLGRPRGPDDIPGSEAPWIYQSYLIDGVDTGLGPIADHNRRDVESLMRLAAVVAAGFAGGDAASHLPAAARLAAARALLRAGEVEAARELLQALADVATHAEVELRAGAHWHLFQCHRRTGDAPRALAALEQLDAPGPWRMQALVEAAKLLEHRFRDFAAARERVLRALRLTEVGVALTSEPRSTAAQQALMHRLRRLERRAARACAGQGGEWTP